MTYLWQFSPGPWNRAITKDGNLAVEMPRDKDHELIIADLEGTCVTCHANAELIAASPDLLSVVLEFLQVVEEWESNPEYEHLICEADLLGLHYQAQVAVAKARGAVRSELDD